MIIMGLKELRLENGFSQEKLAELSGLSLRTIQRIEKNNHGSLESLQAIASIFNLEFTEIKDILENKQLKKEEKIEYNSFFEFIKTDKDIIKYLLINTLLIIINVITSTSHLWFIYPLLGWGIPLFYKKYQKYSKAID
jgi:transcriptional regulator with XRE-family HTH domain